MRTKTLGFAVLIPLMMAAAASAKVANTPQAPMHLGRIWVHPEYDGAEGWGGSAPVYPAGIPTGPDDPEPYFGGTTIKRSWMGQCTKLGVYLSTTDWTSPLGTTLEYASSYAYRSMDYAYPREYTTEVGNYNFPVRIQEVYRWTRPTIVAGDVTLQFFPGAGPATYPDNAGVGPRPDPVVDPNLVTEQAIDCVWRYSQGVESRRRQYGYGMGTAHQDYVLWDAVMVNNGKSYGDIVPTDPKFTLTNQTIHKMIFGQAYDYMNTQAPAAANQSGMDNEAKYIKPWGAAGQSVALGYDLDSQHAAAPGPDWGDPIETAAMEGHLAGNAYIALGPLFSSKGPGALFNTNDQDQPAFRTFQQMRGLDFAGGSYPANSRELREWLVDGALQMPIDQSFRTWTQTQYLADDANGPTAVMGYGPLGGALSVANVKAHGWDLAFNDSVRVVQVMAGGGIDAYEGQRIGQYWNTKKGAAAAPSTWMSAADQALVQTGMDTVSKALALAYWNFNGAFAPNVTAGMKTAWGIPTYVASKPSAYNQPFNVPDPPRPPGYFRARAQASWGNALRWTREAESDPDFDTKVADFQGYRIYRWEASRLAKPTIVAEGPASAFAVASADTYGPAGLVYVDENVTLGTDYWYAVTAYDDGTQNWAEPGKSLESAYFWTWTGFTSKGVTASHSQPTSAPIWTPTPDKTVNVSVLLTFTVSAIDPDGQTVIYSATGLPTGATLNPSTGVFSWTPTSSQAGQYTVTFTASDGIASASDAVVITVGSVTPPPPPPSSEEPLLTLTGHTGAVLSVAVTPDGQTIVSSGEHPDHTVKVWRLSDGTLVRTLTGHTNSVYSVAVSPDGQTIVSGGGYQEYAVRVWRLSDGTLLRTLNGHTGHVVGMTISPDGQLIASASADRTIKLWRLSDGALLRTLTGHTNGVSGVSITPDGQTLVSGSTDNTIKVWRLSDGVLLRTLAGHSDWVNSVRVTPDGQTIVSGSHDQTIKVWRLSDGALLRTLTGHSDWISSVTVTLDGQTIVSGSGDNTIKVWRLSDGALLRTLTGHTKLVRSVAVTPDGQKIVSGAGEFNSSQDNTIKVWALEGEVTPPPPPPADEPLRTLTGHTGPVVSVAVSPDGQTIVSSGEHPDHTIKVWRLSDGILLRTLTGHTNTVWSVAISPDGQTIVSGGGYNDRTVRVWRLSDGAPLRTLTGHTGNLTTVAISPDGQTIVSGSLDSTVKVWRLSDGALLRTLTGHTNAVGSVAVTPDGQTIVSGSIDKTIKVWRLSDGVLLRTLAGHSDWVQGITITPDGQTIVSGSSDKTIKVWRLSDGALLRTLPIAGSGDAGHVSAVGPVAVTPDGQRIVSGGNDATIKVWRLSDGALLRTLTGHTKMVRGVVVTPDGQKIVSGAGEYLSSEDNTIKVWALDGGVTPPPPPVNEPLLTLTGHTGPVLSVAVSPDGQTIVSSGEHPDHTIKVWRLSDGMLLRTLTGHTNSVWSVAISPDGQTIVSGGGYNDRTVRVWRLSDGAPLRTLTGHTGNLTTVAISPDGQTIVSGDLDNAIKVWRLSDGQLLRTLTGHSNGVTRVVVTPDGQTIVSVAGDKTIKVWRLSDGMLLRTLSGHTYSVLSVAVTPDGQTIVSGSDDKTIKVWRLADGTLVRTLPVAEIGDSGHLDPIGSVAVTPNGQTIVSSSNDATIKIWRLSDGALLRTLTGHTKMVRSVVVTPDGQKIVSGAGEYLSTEDNTIKVWALQSAGSGISGEVSTTTWTAASSPYRVTGTVTIPSGNTLTIQPGVDVLFDSTAQFIVQGSIRAVGTAADSIRFLKGAAEEWRGIQISGGDTSTLAYTRISGGYARESEIGGGGITVSDTGTRVRISNSVISDNDAYAGGGLATGAGTATFLENTTISGNHAVARGGGIGNWGTMMLTNCEITGNSASGGDDWPDGGGVANSGTMTMASCTIHRNTSESRGRAIVNTGSLLLTNCTIFGNTPTTSGIWQHLPAATMYLKNSIVWENTFELWDGTVAVDYSAIEGDTVWAGTGNINGDPLFVNASDGDFRLKTGSPCIGTGESGADMGAFGAISSYSMYLPHLKAGAGTMVTLPIRGTVETAYSAEMVFTINSAYLAAGTSFIVSHAFESKQNAQVQWRMLGDTVFVALSASEPVTLFDQPLVTVRFELSSQAPINATMPLSWVPSLTFYNEAPAQNLGDGSMTATALYGDVTRDGTLTALDASQILQFVVHTRTGINETIADVTGNGRVSAFDASWVIAKVVDPDRLFPCEGGEPLPGTKPAAGFPRLLSWARTEAGWALAANDATGIVACDVVLTLAEQTPVDLATENISALRQDGGTLHLSFVRRETEGTTLFSLITSSSAPPEIAEISLNEGWIRTVLPAPATFSLSQNAPNPFNPSTKLRFGLPEAGDVQLVVYDVTGALVRTLVDRPVAAGSHEIVWDGRDAAGREVASGVYIYRLSAKQGIVTRRMVLAR